MSERKAEVCIVGGGIGGLAAAYELGKRGIASIVLEASERTGGRIKTVRMNGAAFDVGAIGLLGSYAQTVALIQELGLGPKLSRAPVMLGVPRQGVLHPLDMGKPLSILRTQLLAGSSLWRARKLAGPMIKHWNKLNFDSMSAMAPYDVEDVPAYARRELNEELFEYLLGPIARALWQRDPEGTPLVDLFWGLKAFAPSMYAIEGGMDYLTTALAAKVKTITGATAQAVEEIAGGARVSYTVNGESRTETFRACILAVPPAHAARLLQPLPKALAEAFAALPYACSTNVHFALSRPIGGRMQIIFPPHSEAPDLTTVVFEHNKGPGRAAPGKGALSLFWRESWSAPRLQADDATVLRDAMAQTRKVVTDFDESLIEAAHVERWDFAGVARSVGGTAAIGAIERAANDYRHLAFAGDFYTLSGVNSALVSGLRAARRIAGA